VPGGGVVRRLLQPAPALVRQRRAGGVRRDGRGGPGVRLCAAPDARRDELRAEPRPGRRPAGAAGHRPRGRRGHHHRHLPIPARCHHAGLATAELDRDRRPGRAADPARRSRDPRTDPVRAGAGRQRRLPRLCRRLGHDRDQRRAQRGPGRRGRQNRRGAGGTDRHRAVGGVLRPTAPRPVGHHDPAAHRARGERPRDHAAPHALRRLGRDPGGCQAAPTRLGHLPALPRALRARARRSRAGRLHPPPHRTARGPAATGQPGPGPGGLPRRSGAVRPRDGDRHPRRSTSPGGRRPASPGCSSTAPP